MAFFMLCTVVLLYVVLHYKCYVCTIWVSAVLAKSSTKSTKFWMKITSRYAPFMYLALVATWIFFMSTFAVCHSPCTASHSCVCVWPLETVIRDIRVHQQRDYWEDEKLCSIGGGSDTPRVQQKIYSQGIHGRLKIQQERTRRTLQMVSSKLCPLIYNKKVVLCCTITM